MTIVCIHQPLHLLFPSVACGLLGWAMHHVRGSRATRALKRNPGYVLRQQLYKTVSWVSSSRACISCSWPEGSGNRAGFIRRAGPHLL